MQSLPGFRDFYPDELAVRNFIFSKWRDTARRYGFCEYDGPPLESLELYTKKSGEEIVGQLYNFTDKGTREVALRPEMTPTLARMVGAHHRDFKKPIKWFAIPQLFRYERQQRGRLREHFQLNADIIGESDASADIELVLLAIDVLRNFGLTEKDFVVRLSDRRAWQKLFGELGVEISRQGAVFQIVDKLEREPRDVTEKMGELLNAEQRERVLKFAEEKSQPVLNLPAHAAAFCETDFKIVRGLAYYTGVVWEIHDRKGELRAIAGGGRYDDLIKNVTGVDLPALGFGMGDVVLAELLKDRGLLPAAQKNLDCYVVIADENLRGESLQLIHDLRDAGLATDFSLTAAKVGKQFELASALGAKFAVMVGAQEWNAGEVTLKNLATRAEERVKVSALVERLKK